MINLIIADDHKLVREAWMLLLQRDKRLSIMAACGSGAEAISVCKAKHPDVVLMDINMEPVNGIQATRAIREFSSDIKIIGISVHSNMPYVNALMQAGGNGYVTKNSTGDEMINAILEVSRGNTYLCREISHVRSN